ncbi:MAG: hypothetical protein CM15mP74_19490 [Halieaceae bacterium]|nr:MAG: hypothetical protein CM15mP74_19490 [Halieaceae bacterium]
MGKIIGIDLGTTNSCVSVLRAVSPRSLKTQRVAGQRHPSSPTQTTTKFWWASRPSGKPLPIQPTLCSR